MLSKEAIHELAQARAIETARDAVQEHGLPAVALPDSFELHNIESMLLQRRRQRGTMSTSMLDSFVDYVQQHRDDGSAVFVNPEQMGAVAVLNLGSLAKPGHADDTAVLKPQRSAAYTALTMMANGQARKQADVAEWLEDWAPHVQAFNVTGELLTIGQAVHGVRTLNVEQLKQVTSTDTQLQASRSSFEQIQATKTETFPAAVVFTCVPFPRLEERSFRVRVAILTGDKPSLVLRLVNAELHHEEMAAELVALIREGLQGTMQVHIGQYQVRA